MRKLARLIRKRLAEDLTPPSAVRGFGTVLKQAASGLDSGLIRGDGALAGLGDIEFNVANEREFSPGVGSRVSFEFAPPHHPLIARRVKVE